MARLRALLQMSWILGTVYTSTTKVAITKNPLITSEHEYVKFSGSPTSRINLIFQFGLDQFGYRATQVLLGKNNFEEVNPVPLPKDANISQVYQHTTPDLSCSFVLSDITNKFIYKTQDCFVTKAKNCHLPGHIPEIITYRPKDEKGFYVYDGTGILVMDWNSCETQLISDANIPVSSYSFNTMGDILYMYVKTITGQEERRHIYKQTDLFRHPPPRMPSVDILKNVEEFMVFGDAVFAIRMVNSVKTLSISLKDKHFLATKFIDEEKFDSRNFFHVIDITSSGVIFICIQQGTAYNLYISDKEKQHTHHVTFHMSLKNIMCIDPKFTNKITIQYEDFTNIKKPFSTVSKMDDGTYLAHQFLDDQVPLTLHASSARSMVTTNDGESWQVVTDHHEKVITLFPRLEEPAWFSFVTSPYATGLVLAQGGKLVDHNRLCLSNDNGVMWKTLKLGSYKFSIGRRAILHTEITFDGEKQLKLYYSVNAGDEEFEYNLSSDIDVIIKHIFEDEWDENIYAIYARATHMEAVQDTIFKIDLNDLVNDAENNYFDTWAYKFGKKYDNHREELFRRAVFGDNKKLITQLNAEAPIGTSYRMNRHGDMTPFEFRKERESYCSMFEDPNYLKNAPRQKRAINGPVWFGKEGVIPPVETLTLLQMPCFVIPVVASIQARAFLMNGVNENLSYDQINDCWPHAKVQKQNGRSKAFQYIFENGGVALSDRYKKNILGGCNTKPEMIAPGTAITGYYAIKKGDTAEIIKQLKHGPVVIAIDANHLHPFHHKGVFRNEKCSSEEKDLNHAMMIVAYGEEDNGERYWLVQNNWGVDWGDHGLIKIAFGENMCGCETSPVHAIVRKVTGTL